MECRQCASGHESRQGRLILSDTLRLHGYADVGGRLHRSHDPVRVARTQQCETLPRQPVLFAAAISTAVVRDDADRSPAQSFQPRYQCDRRSASTSHPGHGAIVGRRDGCCVCRNILGASLPCGHYSPCYGVSCGDAILSLV